MSTKEKRGFTLIEVLVVIGIIAILASIVVIAINPARQFSQANDSQRWSNVNAILNAVSQYAVDNRGALPVSITGTPTEICRHTDSATTTGCTGLVELSMLAPTYIVGMPYDPKETVANETGYTIAIVNGRVVVAAPLYETGTAITVTR
jgi:type IV pilus assembly protein PilA